MKAELRQMDVATTVSVRTSLVRSQADEQDVTGRAERRAKDGRGGERAPSKGRGACGVWSRSVCGLPDAAPANRSHNTSKRNLPPAQVGSHNRPTAKPEPPPPPSGSWLTVGEPSHPAEMGEKTTGMTLL